MRVLEVVDKYDFTVFIKTLTIERRLKIQKKTSFL